MSDKVFWATDESMYCHCFECGYNCSGRWGRPMLRINTEMDIFLSVCAVCLRNKLSELESDEGESDEI